MYIAIIAMEDFSPSVKCLAANLGLTSTQIVVERTVLGNPLQYRFAWYKVVILEHFGEACFMFLAIIPKEP